MDCLFCKIAGGEIPSYKVYEDDYALAFLDIHPHAKGHTVVIPKRHASAISEMNAEEWSALMLSVKRAADRVEKVLRPDGMNIGINDRSAAGQVVPHVHWHIFPRWEGDGGGSVHSIVRNPGDVVVEEVAKMFEGVESRE